MELSQSIKNQVKEKAGKTSCFIWILCGIYCVYTLPHVQLFSWFSLLYFTLGLFASSLTFGVLLYMTKLLIFYLTGPKNEPKSSVMITFWLFAAILSGPIQWMVDFALIYPIYKTTNFLFTYYYF